MTSWGKVRVCDPCAIELSDHRASGCEEDLAVNTEINAQLRNALNQKFAECEEFKRILLELDAEATGSSEQIQRYQEDPENDMHSFGILKERAEEQWAHLTSSLEKQIHSKIELDARHSTLLQFRDDEVQKKTEFAQKRAGMEAQLAQVDKLEAQRQELARDEEELKKAIEVARRQVRELEREKKDHDEQQVERRSRRSSPEPSPPGSPRSRPRLEPVAFTISAGREDPLLRRTAERGCRNNCMVM